VDCCGRVGDDKEGVIAFKGGRECSEVVVRGVDDRDIGDGGRRGGAGAGDEGNAEISAMEGREDEVSKGAGSL
jgi:hypothetical protein